MRRLYYGAAAVPVEATDLEASAGDRRRCRAPRPHSIGGAWHSFAEAAKAASLLARDLGRRWKRDACALVLDRSVRSRDLVDRHGRGQGETHPSVLALRWYQWIGLDDAPQARVLSQGAWMLRRRLGQADDLRDPTGGRVERDPRHPCPWPWDDVQVLPSPDGTWAEWVRPAASFLNLNPWEPR